MRNVRMISMSLLACILFVSSLCGTENQSECICDFVPPGNWELLEQPWLTGYHAVLVVSDTLDDVAQTGERVLLYQMGPNAEINTLGSHDTWEQVVIVEGQLAWLNQDATQSLQCMIEKGYYVNRPPHVLHGPFVAGDNGCLMTVRYYY